MKMKEQLAALQTEALEKVSNIETIKELQDINVAYLGRKGSLTAVLRGMGKLSPEERPVIGELANKVREVISKAIEEKQEVLEQVALNAQLEKETIEDRKSTRLNSSHVAISYAVFCLKKKKKNTNLLK